jgi:hypothetical protein
MQFSKKVLKLGSLILEKKTENCGQKLNFKGLVRMSVAVRQVFERKWYK